MDGKSIKGREQSTEASGELSGDKAELSGSPRTQFVNSHKPTLAGAAAGAPNDDDDAYEHEMAPAEELDGTDDNDFENALAKDYERDYQTVLRLKQQMERNESSPLRRGRKSIFSSLSMPKKPKECKLLAFVIFLFAIIIVGLVVIYHFHEEEFYYIYRGHNIIVNEKTLDAKFTNADGESVLTARLWISRPGRELPYDCSEADLEGHGLCLLWKHFQRLVIRQIKMNNTLCHEVRWKALSPKVTEGDCFELGDASWYGGGIAVDAGRWPLERASIPKQAFVSGAVHMSSSNFGPVIERYWLNSKGVAIIVSEDSPLHFSINSFEPLLNETDRRLCLYADAGSLAPVNKTAVGSYANLNYTICIADDVQQAHMVALSIFGQKRSHRPSTKLFADPIWSTWSYFKDRYNQTILENYATEIDASKFRHSMLMIDDGWEEQYGDLTFSSSKFENPAQLLSSLRSKGFQLSMWSHPQINTNSLAFQFATDSNFLLRDASGDVPGLSRWWNGPKISKWNRGVNGILDIRSSSLSWQHQRLDDFKHKYNINAFHLAGNDVSSLPTHSSLNGEFGDPNEYTKRIVEMYSSIGNAISVQSAYKNQHQPVLIRLGDGTSTWNETGGLGAIIPSVLNLGLIGYPFFIPDAVGGSAYEEMPSKELYVRWLQLSTFLPIMHFSIPPSYYGSEIAALAKDLQELRDRVVVPLVKRAVVEATERLIPIIRPVWWNAPTDKTALSLSTEFLVGDSLLVAPVTTEATGQRDIYLTEGVWEDGLNGNVIIGPKWLYAYDTPLHKVSYFIRR